MKGKPQLFFLGGSKSQEVPLEWYERRHGDPVEERNSIEIAPGVRAQSLGWGDGFLPDKTVGRGVWIAVWSE